MKVHHSTRFLRNWVWNKYTRQRSYLTVLFLLLFVLIIICNSTSDMKQKIFHHDVCYFVHSELSDEKYNRYGEKFTDRRNLILQTWGSLARDTLFWVFPSNQKKTSFDEISKSIFLNVSSDKYSHYDLAERTLELFSFLSKSYGIFWKKRCE